MRLLYQSVSLGLCLYASPSVSSLANHAELSIAGGIARINSSTPSLMATATEIDSLYQTSHHTTAIGAIGWGYDYLLTSHKKTVIHNILIGLRLYDFSVTNRGQVYQYGDAQLNNFSYSLPVHSTRLILDEKLVAMSWHQVSPYILAGLGAS